MTIKEKLKKQSRPIPLIIFVDIDDTWEVTLQEHENNKKYKFDYFKSKCEEAWQLAHDNHIPIISVTGRYIEEVIADNFLYIKDPVSENEILPFDALYCNLGAQGYINIDERFHEDAEWDAYIQANIGYKRSVVYPLCVEALKTLKRQYKDRIYFEPKDSPENIAAWEADPSRAIDQKPLSYKVSIDFIGTEEEMKAVSMKFHHILKEHHLERVKVFISFAQKHGYHSRYNIDIIPVTKVDPIAYICQKYQCHGLFAGDSNNDYDALKEFGFAMMNPKPELVKKMSKLITKETPHFMMVTDPETGTSRLIYKDPSALKNTKPIGRGPEILIDALNAYLLLETIVPKSSTLNI